MTTSVKFHTYSDVSLPQPYLARESLVLDRDVRQTGNVLSSDENTKWLSVEISNPELSSSKMCCRFEVNHNGRAVVADQDSPLLYNGQLIKFGPGSKLSLAEYTHQT